MQQKEKAYSLLEPEVRAGKAQRHGNAEPQREQSHHRAEGNGRRAARRPKHGVHDEEVDKDQAGTEQRRHQHIRLPSLPAAHLVDTRRHVAGWRAQAHIHDEGAGHEGATVGRREEAEAGEDQRDQRHEEDLHTGAEEHGQQHCASRRPKDVAMNKLPSKLFLSFLLQEESIQI